MDVHIDPDVLWCVLCRCQSWGHSRELCPGGYEIKPAQHVLLTTAALLHIKLSKLSAAGSKTVCRCKPMTTSVLVLHLLLLFGTAGYCRKCHMAGHTTDTCGMQHCSMCGANSHDSSRCPLQNVRNTLSTTSEDHPMPWDVQAALHQKQQQRQQQWPPGAVTVASLEMASMQTMEYTHWQASSIGQYGDQHSGYCEEGTWGGAGQATDYGCFGGGGWSEDPQLVYQQNAASDQCLQAAAAHTAQQGPPVRRGTGALSQNNAVVAAAQGTAMGQAAAAEHGGMSDGEDTGVPVDFDVGASDDIQYRFAAMSKAGRYGRAGAAQAAAWSTNSSKAPAATSAALSMAGGAAAAALQPGSAAWTAAMKQLLMGPSVTDVKWRAILPPPSGDRVGPFTAAEMVGWLTGGRAPRGVAGTEARRVEADPTALLVCAIEARSYNPQRLPGEH